MPSKKYLFIIDTNALVRLATYDLPEVAKQILEKILAQGDRSIFLSEAVVAELVYVLSSPNLYALSRQEVCDAGKQIINLEQLDGHKELLGLALDTFAGTDLDFVDCLLIAHYRMGTAAGILTLDKKLLKAA